MVTLDSNPASSPASAVVIGAGIAGLTAAAALATRVARVIVLDRDALPSSATPRRGVPQGHHGHVLLAAGQEALWQLFPGLLEELTQAGAVPFDPGVDLSFYRYGAVWPRVPTDIGLVAFSRPLLEFTLRRRVAALPNAQIRDNTAASDLTGVDGRVTGVVLDDGEVISCELVVDCSGRGSRSDRWLAELGFAAPKVVEVKIGVGYSTRLLRRKPGDLTDAVAVFVLPAAPHERKAGLALPIEDDRWLVSLGGWHGDFPGGNDEESFLAHARSLPHPAIAALLERCEPLTEIVSYQFPSSRRRRFEDLSGVPAGYVALGDAICSFNPVYGQGMTCAAVESVALGELLDRHGSATAALSRDFYQRVSQIISTPWQFAAGGDFAYPQTVGERPRGIGLLNRYSRQIQLAAQVDPDIRRTFVAVQHLIMSPSVLRRPAMILRVLRAARRAPGNRLS